MSDTFPPRTWADWLALLESDPRTPDLPRLRSRTEDGLPVEPLYTADAPHTRRLPDAGRAATRPAGQGWRIAIPVTCAGLEQACAQIRTERAGGATSFFLRLDRSQRLGRDTDQRGRRPADGLEVCTAADFAALREAAGDAELVVDAGIATPAALALAAPANGPLRAGTDPLCALAAEGDSAGDPEYHLDAWAALVAGDTGSHALALRGDLLHEAGATTAQELGGVLASLAWQLRVLESRGIPPERVLARTALHLAAGRDVFEQLAKFRAAAILVSRMAQACGVAAEGPAPTLHGVTSARTLAARDPWTNLLRLTTEVFAAAAGGAHSICALPFDAPLQAPSAFSARITRNLQLVLREESHLGHVADPAAGSWYIESLTASLVDAGWAELQRIEAAGGMPAYLHSGGLVADLAEATRKRHEDVARGRFAITGVNLHATLEEKAPPAPEPAVDEDAAARVRRWREVQGLPEVPVLQGADPATCWTRLQRAASEGATLEHLVSALQAGGAEGITVPALPRVRDAAPFEALRDEADRITRATGTRPRVFLANMGPLREHRPRAMFSAGFFGAGGFEVVGNDGFSSVEEAAAAARESGALLGVFCAPDEAREAWLEKLTPALREAGLQGVIVAGRPGEEEPRWRACGVDGFIWLGGPMVPVLEAWLARAGGAA